MPDSKSPIHPRRTLTSGGHRLSFEVENAQWWEREAYRGRMVMKWNLFRDDLAAVAEIAAAKVQRIGIEEFLVSTRLRNAYTIAVSRNGCKIAHNQNAVSWISGLPLKSNHAAGAVLKVDPFKAAIIKINLVQGRFSLVELVNAVNEPLDPLMRIIGQ